MSAMHTSKPAPVVACSEFGEQQGNIMVIVKSLLHGLLNTCGARFHEKFVDSLLSMHFLLPCKADPDVWMRDCGVCACVCIDDLAVMMKDPSLLNSCNASPNSRVLGRSCTILEVISVAIHQTLHLHLRIHCFLLQMAALQINANKFLVRLPQRMHISD